MKKFINILLVAALVVSVSSPYAFAKKKTDDATQKTVQEKVKKEKKTKEKTTKEKKVKNTDEQAKDDTSEKPAKVKKSKKTKETSDNEKPVKKKIKDLSTMTQAEREQAYLEQHYNPQNRSKLAKMLNPNLDVTEIRASHILVKNRKDAVNIRKDILEGKISFEDAARAYSLCPTGVNGGDLGYFNRKRMDQQFTDRAFDLKIGEISDPVGTKFGWHLIKLVDRR